MAIKVKKLLYIIAAFKEHLIDTWLLAKKVGGGGLLLAKNVEKMLNFIVLFWEKIVEQMHNFIVVFWGKNRLRGRERVLSICDTFWAQSHDLLSAKKSEKIIDIICAFYDIGGMWGFTFHEMVEKWTRGLSAGIEKALFVIKISRFLLEPTKWWCDFSKFQYYRRFFLLRSILFFPDAWKRTSSPMFNRIMFWDNFFLH